MFFDLVLGLQRRLYVLCPTKRQNWESTSSKPQIQPQKKEVVPEERKLKADSVALHYAGSCTVLAREQTPGHSVCFELFVTWLLYISMPSFVLCSLFIVLHNRHSAKIILIYILTKIEICVAKFRHCPNMMIFFDFATTLDHLGARGHLLLA